MRLRTERPRVTRLSRKVLAGGAAIGLVAISGAVLWALQNNRSRSAAPAELYTTDHRNVADGLTGLPRDYAGIPRQAPPLGPALPGDLGRPILNAQNAPSATIPTVDWATRRQIEAAPESTVCIDEYSRTGVTCRATAFGRCFAYGPEPDGSANRRRSICAEWSGSETCLRQRPHRSSYDESGSRRRTGVVLCGAGRQRHPGVSHYRHPLGPARPDHSPGNRECL